LSAVLPGLISLTSICRLTKASVIGRRPNGVVTLPICIFFTFKKAKETCSPNYGAKDS